MKKFVIGLALIFETVLFSGQAAAMTEVEKPALPGGYESWPHQYRGVCLDDQKRPLKVSLSGRINDKTTFEYIYSLMPSQFTEPFLYGHGTSTGKEGVLVLYIYEKNWFRLDTDNGEDIMQIMSVMSLVDLTMQSTCPHIMEEMGLFFKELEEELDK